MPNGVESSYEYDDAGRLLLLTHNTITETLASYSYSLDQVGNRRTLTETLAAVGSIPAGAYLESDGLVVLEAENGERTNGQTHDWLLQTTLPGYTGTSYLQSSLDIDALYQTTEITASPKAEYAVNFTTAETYTVWLRGSAENPGNDSVYVGLNDELVSVSGFGPEGWYWASEEISTQDISATVSITKSGVYTLSLWMREDGLQLDRLLLITDTAYVPTGVGPVESARQLFGTTTLTRTMVYTYDGLYRLTEADYSTGELYEYEYDPVGNRLKQIIDGDTTDYLYDAANRLASVDGQSYSFDDNGNLLQTDAMLNQFDGANRLVETNRDGHTVEPVYNGINDRVGQKVDEVTTNYALDVQGLPEVIYTSEGNAYLHLPGVIMTESESGDVRYLLSDGLGSVRQAVEESGALVAYHEFDPYGTPVQGGGEPYGYTAEWWQADVGLLHLRARWYLPGSGTFLSRDVWEGFADISTTRNGYNYANNDPINLTDSTGFAPPAFRGDPPSRAVEECFKIAPCRQAVVVAGGTAIAIIGPGAVLVVVPAGLTLICTVFDCSPAPSMPPQPAPTPQPTGTPIPQPQPQPEPSATPSPGPLPAPRPNPAPQPPETCTPEPDDKGKRKHISLGLSNRRDRSNRTPLLFFFTLNLNEKLNKQNIIVYAYGGVSTIDGGKGWHDAGLSKVTTGYNFRLAFDQAAESAEGLHFNLEDIPGNPVSWAKTKGPTMEYITAYELYKIITHPHLCNKTKFYQEGSTNVNEDTSVKIKICGQ